MEHLMYICIRFRNGYDDDHGNPFGRPLSGLTNTIEFHEEIVEWFDKEFKNKHGI